MPKVPIFPPHLAVQKTESAIFAAPAGGVKEPVVNSLDPILAAINALTAEVKEMRTESATKSDLIQ